MQWCENLPLRRQICIGPTRGTIAIEKRVVAIPSFRSVKCFGNVVVAFAVPAKEEDFVFCMQTSIFIQLIYGSGELGPIWIFETEIVSLRLSALVTMWTVDFIPSQMCYSLFLDHLGKSSLVQNYT